MENLLVSAMKDSLADEREGTVAGFDGMLDLNPKRAEKELEGIILILDTHIADAQSVRLGYFYKAYIIKEIPWEQFEELKQVNQRNF